MNLKHTGRKDADWIYPGQVADSRNGGNKPSSPMKAMNLLVATLSVKGN